MRIAVFLIAVVLAAVPSTLTSAAVAAAKARPAAEGRFATVALTATTASGRHAFEVELARTEAEQARGLMYRKPLPPHRGMIFPMQPPRAAAFWMKNTPSPLDIIFIAPGGRVLRVAAMTEPYSLDAIDSGGPVEAVLEIRGGRAAEIGLRPGDKVEWGHR